MSEDEYDKIANENFSLGKISGVQIAAKRIMEDALALFERGNPDGVKLRDRALGLKVEAGAMRVKHDKDFPK
jgi:hypothetical protein